MSDIPRVPSAWQLEHAVSAWQQAGAFIAADPDFEADQRAAYASLTDGTGLREPGEYVARMLDAVVWIELDAERDDQVQKRIAARRDRGRARAAYVRELAKGLMLAIDLKSQAATIVSGSIARAPVAVIVTDADRLADEYVRIETIRTPDKRLIKEHIEAGVVIEGAELSNPGFVLRMKVY